MNGTHVCPCRHGVLTAVTMDIVSSDMISRTIEIKLSSLRWKTTATILRAQISKESTVATFWVEIYQHFRYKYICFQETYDLRFQEKSAKVFGRT